MYGVLSNGTTQRDYFPMSKIEKFDEIIRRKIKIDYPKVEKFYNRYMDNLLGRHRNKIRSKKLYLFHYLLDMTIIMYSAKLNVQEEFFYDIYYSLKTICYHDVLFMSILFDILYSHLKI